MVDANVPTAEKTQPIVDEVQIQAFEHRLKGQLIRSGEADYDEARSVWNGMIDRYPDFSFSGDLRYRWTFDLPPSAREHIQGEIRFDSQRYAVIPCHPGTMTATVQRIGGARGHYLYELRCVCEAMIRTDGGILPARTEQNDPCPA